MSLCWESIHVCVTFCRAPTWLPEMNVFMTHVCVFMLPKCQPKSQGGVSSSKVFTVHTTGSAPWRCMAPDTDVLWVLLVVVSRQENNDKVMACKETKGRVWHPIPLMRHHLCARSGAWREQKDQKERTSKPSTNKAQFYFQGEKNTGWVSRKHDLEVTWHPKPHCSVRIHGGEFTLCGDDFEWSRDLKCENRSVV